MNPLLAMTRDNDDQMLLLKNQKETCHSRRSWSRGKSKLMRGMMNCNKRFHKSVFKYFACSMNLRRSNSKTMEVLNTVGNFKHCSSETARLPACRGSSHPINFFSKNSSRSEFVSFGFSSMIQCPESTFLTVKSGTKDFICPTISADLER